MDDAAFGVCERAGLELSVGLVGGGADDGGEVEDGIAII